MSMMTFCVMDATRAISSEQHGSFVDELIPALCDDPQTIDELSMAMRRFRRPGRDGPSFETWQQFVNDQPFDAGLCLIDLPGRLIVYESSYMDLFREGRVVFRPSHLQDGEELPWIGYHLSNEWMVLSPMENWRGASTERRAAHAANPPFDTRSVLYTEVIPFVVDACASARGGVVDQQGRWTPPAHWTWRQLPDRVAQGETARIEDGVAEIHARWLMTPRPDLRNRSPRDVLLEKREHLTWQVQDREFEWSMFRRRPIALWRESAAYQYAGYGTHEIVLYYELLRYLIRNCWAAIVTPTEHDNIPPHEKMVGDLSAQMQDWLHTPNHEYLHGKTPTWVITCERLRLPFALGVDDNVIDDDCPACQAAATFGPMFWHLDGSEMDPELPFDFWPTNLEDANPANTWDHVEQELPWNEAQWERFIQRSEVRSAKFGELFETLSDDPNHKEIIAAEMGWDLHVELPEAIAKALEQVDLEEHGPPPSDREADGQQSLRDDDAALEAIEAYREGRDWAHTILNTLPGQVETMGKSARSLEDLLDVVYTSALSVPVKIAGAHGMGYDDDTLCGNIVCCRHALAAAEEALSALEEIGRDQLLPLDDIQPIIDQGQRVQELLKEHISELRSNVWWQ